MHTAMQAWGAFLRYFPPATICAALLYFGSWMIDKASAVPVGVQTGMAFVGSIMMMVGGIGLVLILPHAIYRWYTKKITSA